MNGHHQHVNGISNNKPATSLSNGDVLSKNVNASPAKALNVPSTVTNGMSPGPHTSESTSQPFSIDMSQLPQEILDMLAEVPEGNYVSLAKLVQRSTHACWSDLLTVLRDLSNQPEVKDPLLVDRFMPPPDTNIKNDVSSENRQRKNALWEFSMRCKHVLAKLLTLMQWASKRDENRLTIALNIYIHKLRAAYVDANQRLVDWIKWAETRQDAAPDFDTAAQILAKGRVDNLPELGYVQAKDVHEKQLLKTLENLNLELRIRMLNEPDIPATLQDWHIHDGRITFHVADEFDLDVFVIGEEDDARFWAVDLKCGFTPSPMVSQDLLDYLTNTVNEQLRIKGLQGAYDFLHELILTQKIKELHAQALRLRSGLWVNHLRVEMIKRVLIIQYWAQRPSTKSWIEVVLNSGRGTKAGVPFIELRWMRNKQLVNQHEIEVDLASLSIESILTQVIAQHTSFLFDSIYDRLAATKIFEDGQLLIEQATSQTDAFDCNLVIDISKRHQIQVTCDPIAGTMVVSPASDRANRFQHDLSRSANIVDDFMKRFPALRCGLSQGDLTKVMQNTSWISLPGRRPTMEEVKSLFGPSVYRAIFFRQAVWTMDWSLAATFGVDGDRWYLVKHSKEGSHDVQPLGEAPIHLQTDLSREYLSSLSEKASATISLRTVGQGAEQRRIKTALPNHESLRKPHLRMQLDRTQQMTSFGVEVVVAPFTSKGTKARSSLFVFVNCKAASPVLEKLATSGLDSNITINPEKKTIMMEVPCLVGEDKISAILDRLKYVDDLLSCIKLAHNSDTLQLRELDLTGITIGYYSNAKRNHGIQLLFSPPPDGRRILLSPPDTNPHTLVADHLDDLVADASITMSERLRRLLSTLRMTLPLVRSLQYLQGRLTSEDVPEMKDVDVEQAQKWLKTHVLVRDTIRFGLQIFAVNPLFGRDQDGADVPMTMLVRLEIIPHPKPNGDKLSWLVRPAIEEFRSYTRPSFTGQDLKQEIKQKIFSSDQGQAWIALDSAATCLTTNPYGLIAALYKTILGWVQKTPQLQEEPSAPVQQIQARPNNAPPNSRPQPQNRQQTQGQPNAQQQRMLQQRQQQQQQQNRPQNMQNTGMNPNAPAGGRVMVANSQQIRAPPNNNNNNNNNNTNNRRLNPNQNQNQNQARNANQQGRAVPGPRDQVINIDD